MRRHYALVSALAMQNVTEYRRFTVQSRAKNAPEYEIFHAFIHSLAVFLSGCSNGNFSSGHGDAGLFILQQAIARGGSPITNSLPVIPDRWRYLEDKNGVVIRMSRQQYPTVEAFLRQAFGEPKLEPTDTPKGKVGAWRLSSNGGAVQASSNAAVAQIIILNPIGTDKVLIKQ